MPKNNALKKLEEIKSEIDSFDSDKAKTRFKKHIAVMRLASSKKKY